MRSKISCATRWCATSISANRRLHDAQCPGIAHRLRPHSDPQRGQFCGEEGEFIGILGHNGMGKTTLLKALMGFWPPTAGHVAPAAKAWRAPEPYRRPRPGP